ncbi:MAG: cation:proton antiporter [Sphingomonadaceae bacterium]|nr:cation:proton antiporter [Sphingomonadaceae bacterium]
MDAGQNSSILSDAIVILGAAGIVIPAFARLRITPIIGFILVGVLVGPHGLGSLVGQYPWLQWMSIQNGHAIEPFAEFGIILLLFSIGLELSFRRLWTMRRRVFGVGPGKLFGGGLVIALALMLTGHSWPAAAGLGVALAMSSTALVLPISGTSGRVGQNAFAMLLFEDLALVPIIFLLGAIGPAAGEDAVASLTAILMRGGLTILILGLIGWFFLPILFAQAARAKSPELFLSASLLVVIVAALATSNAGLSPIVGALIAGLLIAETEYHGEVEGIIAPFRGLALGVFLITVGMQINLAALAADWPRLTIAVLSVVAIKAMVTAAFLRWARVGRGTAAEVGLLMGSPSETTLIVLGAAVQAGLIATDTAAFWQVVTAIGLTITPLLASLGHRLARRIDTSLTGKAAATGDVPQVLIIGFGRVGQVVADLLVEHDRAYTAYESDIDTVAEAQRRGYQVSYGDAARGNFLDHFVDTRLSAVVLTMDDPAQQLRLIRRLRARYDDIPIITRARDSADAAAQYQAGANDAVPEALEGSLQMAEAVLVDIGVAVGPVIASIHEHRAAVRARILGDNGADGIDGAPRPRAAVRRRSV